MLRHGSLCCPPASHPLRAGSTLGDACFGINLSSCFKGPEAPWVLHGDGDVAAAACRGNKQNTSAGLGASSSQCRTLSEMLLLSATAYFMPDVSLKPQERMGSCAWDVAVTQPRCWCGSSRVLSPCPAVAQVCCGTWQKGAFKSHGTSVNASSAGVGASAWSCLSK